MLNKINLFVITLFLAIIIGRLAIAQTCPDVIGDWDFNIQSAYYDPSTNTYGYETHNGVFHIISQDGCLFYGNREVEGSESPLTGAISLGGPVAITMTSDDRIFSGTLRGYVDGLYTIIKYVRSNLGISSSDKQKTGLGKATRR